MNYLNCSEALDSGAKALGVDCERFSLFLDLALNHLAQPFTFYDRSLSMGLRWSGLIVRLEKPLRVNCLYKILPAAANATKVNQNAGASRDWNVSVNHEAMSGEVLPKIACPVVKLRATPE